MLHDWLTFIVILLALGLLLAVGTVLGMALMLLRPLRMTDGRAIYYLRRLSPGDLGLPFEDLTFTVRDERGARLIIKAWWIAHPHARGRTAVLMHGYGDAKVGGIAWAPTFHSLGFNVLAIDLRAHGESGGSYCTGAYFERDDVAQVIDQLRAARPNDTATLVLFGVSLGAAVAAAVAARRDDVDAVVMESPYPDYDRAVDAHSIVLGQPRGLVQRLGVRVAELISGARFDDVRPTDLIPRVRAPLMIVQAGHDPFVPPADAALIERAAASRPPELVTTYWHIADAPHVQGLGVDPAEYRRRVEAFLDAALDPSQSARNSVVQPEAV